MGEVRDDKAQRRDHAGTLAGAVTGGTMGLLMGLAISGLGALESAVLGGIFGAALGRWLARRVSPEEWEPGSAQPPFVGAHAPDSGS
jgi:hypothetical protein